MNLDPLRASKALDDEPNNYNRWQTIFLGPSFGLPPSSNMYSYPPGDLTLAECQELVDKLTLYAMWKPEVTEDFQKATHGISGLSSPIEAFTDPWYMHLPPWSRRPGVIIHECAHCYFSPLEVERDHGPLFRRFYVELLVQELGMSREVLESSLRDYRLDVYPSSAFTTYMEMAHARFPNGLPKVSRPDDLDARIRRAVEESRRASAHRRSPRITGAADRQPPHYPEG